MTLSELMDAMLADLRRDLVEAERKVQQGSELFQAANTARQVVADVRLRLSTWEGVGYQRVADGLATFESWRAGVTSDRELLASAVRLSSEWRWSEVTLDVLENLGDALKNAGEGLTNSAPWVALALVALAVLWLSGGRR